MRDKEIYQGPEHWPQPEDEKATLDQSRLAALKKKQKKSASKARKKMSESFSGAAVTVVAAAVLIGALPEIPELRMLTEIPAPTAIIEKAQVETGPICPLCSRVNCPYYRNSEREGELYGLWVDQYQSIEYTDISDIYAMPGFSEEDADDATYDGCIYTTEGQRLLLRLTTDMRQYLPKFEGRVTSTSRFSYNGTRIQPSNTGKVTSALDSDGNVVGFIISALVYASDGVIPDIRESSRYLQDSHFYGEDVRLLTQPVEGCPNAQVQYVTNIPGLEAETLSQATVVTVIQEQYLAYPLGATMTFTENEQYRRTYLDRCSGSVTRYYDFPDGRRFLNTRFPQKSYNIQCLLHPGTDIVFSMKSWLEIFDYWQSLNEDAPNHGHEVSFPLFRLKDVSYNGITYQVFAFYSAEADPENEGHRLVTCYYIPQQEPCMALSWHMSLTQEELEAMLSTQTMLPNFFQRQELLSQITLRSSKKE